MKSAVTKNPSILDANGSRIIWGFLLENTLFTEFEEHNHAIIETAYRQRKKKHASHYIVIVDANLPKPRKAKVYFGVVQNHLRMPGTRYYVSRQVVRPNTTSVSNIAVVTSSSLATPPLLMPSPTSTISSSTSSTDTAYPTFDCSIAALFSDDLSFSPSIYSSTPIDCANILTSSNGACNFTSMSQGLSTDTYSDNLLLDMAVGSIPHFIGNSITNMECGITNVFYDHDRGYQLINNDIGDTYFASDNNVNHLDQIVYQSNKNEKNSTNCHISYSDINVQRNLNILNDSCRKIQRQNMDSSMDYSMYQQQEYKSYNYKSSNNELDHVDPDITCKHVCKYNLNDNTINENDRNSNTNKHAGTVSNTSSAIVGDMDELSFWDISVNNSNPSFQESVSWPASIAPKSSYGREEGDSSTNYYVLSYPILVDFEK